MRKLPKALKSVQAFSARIGRVVWVHHDRDGIIRYRLAFHKGWSLTACVCGDDVIIYDPRIGY